MFNEIVVEEVSQEQKQNYCHDCHHCHHCHRG